MYRPKVFLAEDRPEYGQPLLRQLKNAGIDCDWRQTADSIRASIDALAPAPPRAPLTQLPYAAWILDANYGAAAEQFADARDFVTEIVRKRLGGIGTNAVIINFSISSREEAFPWQTEHILPEHDIGFKDPIQTLDAVIAHLDAIRAA